MQVEDWVSCTHQQVQRSAACLLCSAPLAAPHADLLIVQGSDEGAPSLVLPPLTVQAQNASTRELLC